MKILLDLKPALDGFAGIPQETRILFRGLCALDQFAVEGLIQHGGRRLRPAIPARGKPLEHARRINRLSRCVVSVDQKPYTGSLAKAADFTSAFFDQYLLHVRSLLGMSISPSLFQSELFEDFLWRTFFSKSLKPADKDLVTRAQFRVLTQSRKLLHRIGLAGLQWSTHPSYARIDTTDFDWFVAQTPFPGRVSSNTRLVIRYHDAVPILLPHTLADKAFHQASHFYALLDNVRQGAFFCCVSESSRKDLLQIFPEAEERSTVIHNMVSDEYYVEETPQSVVLQIIRNRVIRGKEFSPNLSTLAPEKPLKYLLMVSTVEPRKNHALLLAAWERLKYSVLPDLKLVIVGSPGWMHEAIVKTFKPWVESGDLFHLANLPSSELRVLYKHAAATLCPSVSEGFDFSGVEAMLCGGLVISSDIPVHREVYEDASAYFNPYSAEESASVIANVLNPENTGEREALRAAACEVAGRYSEARILPKWETFLEKTSGSR